MKKEKLLLFPELKYQGGKPKLKSIKNLEEEEINNLFKKHKESFGYYIRNGFEFADIILIDYENILDMLPFRLVQDLASLNYDIFGWLKSNKAIEL